MGGCAENQVPRLSPELSSLRCEEFPGLDVASRIVGTVFDGEIAKPKHPTVIRPSDRHRLRAMNCLRIPFD
jgi:hypothetical protein